MSQGEIVERTLACFALELALEAGDPSEMASCPGDFVQLGLFVPLTEEVSVVGLIAMRGNRAVAKI